MGPVASTVTLRDAESWSRTLNWVVDHPDNLVALRNTLMRAVPSLGAEARDLAEKRLLELFARELASGEVVISTRDRLRPNVDLLDDVPEDLTALDEADAGDSDRGTEETTPAPAPVVECVLDVVTYACSHKGERKAALRLEAGTSTKSRVLEVIAADKGNGDIITVTPQYSAAPCSTHATKALLVRGRGLNETLGQGEQQVEVFYDSIDQTDLLGYFWSWNKSGHDFTFSPQVCTGHGVSATVRVYPALEASAHIMLMLETRNRVDNVVAKAQSRGYHEKRGRPAFTEWRFEVAAKVKYGPHASEFSIGNKDQRKDPGRVERWAAFNRLIKRSIDVFADNLAQYACVSMVGGSTDDKVPVLQLRPMFPQLEIEYTGKYEEIASSPKVGTAWSVKLKANPLLGLEARLEILALFIQAMKRFPKTAPVGYGLEKVREWAKKKKQTIELYIALQGVIEGDCGIEKKAELAKGSATGHIQGAIKVLFEAVAALGSSGYIGFAFGAEVKGNTGLAVRLQLDHDSKGVFMAGKFVLLECKFKAAAWASGKFIWEIKESYEGEFQFWQERDLLSTGNKYVLTN